ncbi:MAG: GH39 [uncultured Thermomicrobiales bacterium]|uniref:GH39 n=1 Tax=uncultured Thermomicrobiales bacterium TaxID=1645740 RepID=A0A6J4UDM0_9BACT|nr:MAG: GH39 [uncultured Thermomicrobiales bacterium]
MQGQRRGQPLPPGRADSHRRARPAGPAPGAPRPARARGRRAKPVTVGPVTRWVAATLAPVATRPEAIRALRAVAIGLAGLFLLASAALADRYLHRGIERGDERPYVVHPAGRPPAANVDLLDLSAAQLDAAAAALQAAGIRIVRQSFAWSEIEPGPGQYVWDRHDALLDALEPRGIAVLAVLHRSPDWARAGAARGFPDAPPADNAAYAAFVERTGRHFGPRVRYYQIWDLPNLPDRWGGAAVDPADYAALLAQGANAVRQGAPGAAVVLAEFAPAPPDGVVTDLDLLDGVYRAGAAAFFDIVAARVDGGDHAPTDRLVGADRQNLGRATLFRDRMLRWNDQATPIWATRYGWRTGDGGVSPAEQARFAVGGLRRAAAEWPWMGTMFAGDLVPNAAAAESGNVLLPDGQPAPLLAALGDHAQETAGVAGVGYLPGSAPTVTYEGGWVNQDLGEGFRTTTEVGAVATLRFRGSGLIATLRFGPQAGILAGTIDGEPLPGQTVENGTGRLDLESSLQARDIPIRLVDGLDPDAIHELRLSLAAPGELTVGPLIVVREIPFLWPVATLAAGAALLLFVAVREGAYLVARLAGHLRDDRAPALDLRPSLPHLPDWRPSRRA